MSDSFNVNIIILSLSDYLVGSAVGINPTLPNHLNRFPSPHPSTRPSAGVTEPPTPSVTPVPSSAAHRPAAGRP